MNITEADLRRLAPRAKPEIIMPIIPATLAAYGITTALRFCHFIAHGCLMASALEPLPAYDAQRQAAGLPPFARMVPTMPTKPPATSTGPPAAEGGI